MRLGIYVFEIVTIYISSYQVSKVPQLLLTLLVRIRYGQESSFLTILLYFESSKTHTSYSNTQKTDIYGHICACYGEEPPYAGKAKEYVSWIQCDSCGMWEHLECLEGEDVPDANWFFHTAAKSWMMWLNTKNV